MQGLVLYPTLVFYSIMEMRLLCTLVPEEIKDKGNLQVIATIAIFIYYFEDIKLSKWE